MRRTIRNCKKGNTVSFGNYRQGAEADCPKTPIEWLVLEADADALLLLSRDILDVADGYGVRYYQTEEARREYPDMPVYDANYDVGEWLNVVFAEEAFNEPGRRLQA